MTLSSPSPSPAPSASPAFDLAHCTVCDTWTFPANAPGCRQCGAPPAQLRTRPCPTPLRLLNFITEHAPLAPGLAVPAVIGEVALAPGLVEEARIDVADEGALTPGMPLVPHWQIRPADAPGEAAGGWVFRPAGEEHRA
jgi:hypothetical protein